MKGAVKCEGPIQLESVGPKVVALVGPTGAGKTTTIAKLAAQFALQQNKKVAMISLDTYRMGAWEQLESYGELMQVPVSLAADRREFVRILQEHQDRDIILVDTMGEVASRLGLLQTVEAGVGSRASGRNPPGAKRHVSRVRGH